MMSDILINICSDNGLSSVWHNVITWTNTDILSIRPSGHISIEFYSKFRSFHSIWKWPLQKNPAILFWAQYVDHTCSTYIWLTSCSHGWVLLLCIVKVMVLSTEIALIMTNDAIWRTRNYIARNKYMVRTISFLIPDERRPHWWLPTRNFGILFVVRLTVFLWIFLFAFNLRYCHVYVLLQYGACIICRECCARSRYQGQRKVIKSHSIFGM